MEVLEIKKEVQKYYGEVLQNSKDLKTNACCTTDAYPDHVKSLLSKVHSEVLAKYYGCGLALPQQLEGTAVLDLGSGSGRDCYLLSHMVGEQGKVVGVDMTFEQLEVAKRYTEYHREAFGYKESNVTFLKGEIEKLDELDLADGTFDIVTSNCVINLSSDKGAVLQQAWRVLKEGGELYFSDVYADRRVPEPLTKDPVLYGECLSGALYWNDFLNLAKAAGFTDPRVVSSTPITIENSEVQEKVGGIKFYSVTYRLFKLPELESDCEDYGQAVVYKGSVENSAHQFVLDDHHVIEAGKVFPVCGNTYRMLNSTRFKPHFDFIGNWETHYGIFEGCGGNAPFNTESSSAAADPQACC